MITPTNNLTIEHTANNSASDHAHNIRKLLSISFNQGAQTLDEATVSAHSMAASLESEGLLLRVPREVVAL